MPPVAESSVKSTMALFCYRHKDVLKVPYMISYGKDQAIMKQVIATYGAEKTSQLILDFFNEVPKDPFLQKAGITVGIFKTQIPKLLLRAHGTQEKEQIGRL